MSYQCPKCTSTNVSTERRPNGDSRCLRCGHSDHTANFVEFSPKAFVSMNGRFVLESYKEDRALKATVQNGFAMVSQKVSLKPLRVLADVYSPVTGELLAKAGDKAYVREAYLQSQPWAKQTFTADGIEGEFMIAEMAHVEFVGSK